MKLMARIAVTTVLATGFSMAAQAADVNAAPTVGKKRSADLAERY